MAEEYTRVSGNISGTDNTDSDELVLTEGGVVVVDYTWTAGSATLPVETSLDAGTTYVPFTDSNGTAITASISTSTKHYRAEFLGQAGQRFRINPSGATSADIDYRMSVVKVS